jgi:Mg2+/Co2+ transporter CorC
VSSSAFVARIKSWINLAFSKERRSHVAFSEVQLLKSLFDIEHCDRQRANHFESEEADDIGGIVVGFEVEIRW